MKTVNEKQAIYISKLTYALYKLRGCNNFKTVVSIEDAMKISADIATDMIHELKAKVHEEEYDQYVKPYIRAFAEQIELKPLSLREYKKIDKVTPIDNLLIVCTTDDVEYKINESYEFILGSKPISFRGIYNNLINAINYDLGVSILIEDGVCIVTLEDIERDKALINAIELINEILDITDGLLFKDHKGNFTRDYLSIILKFVEMKNMKVAERLGSILTNPKEGEFLCGILSASQQHFYGIQ
jgi:hypothetical protein